MNKNLMINILKSMLLKLPTPTNISYWWNLGSLLGMFMMIQLLSGFFLSMHYCPNTSISFNSIIHMIQNVNFGWMMHNIHINSATLFFICLYAHMSRGLYYNSFKLHYTWTIGTSIFFISMATAFLGYVLPWGQMSFWGATVITNLISTIPYIGNTMTQWIWGGYSINNATLNRFYSVHFILPFLVSMMILLHLYFLHITGSSNPLGLNSNLNKLPFHIYFTWKDLLLMMMVMYFLFIIILQYPYIFNDPDNFTTANPLSTPPHIQPEWYFLFAYAILRSIPNKLGGVIALIMSIVILYFLPLTSMKMNSLSFYPVSQLMFWAFINIFILLTWVGSQPIELPYIYVSQTLSSSYFLYFILLPFLTKIWDNLLYCSMK